MLNSFSDRAAAAYQHDGTVNSARALHVWVAFGRYSKPEDPMEATAYTRAQLTTPDGHKICLNTGDWLVHEPNGTFRRYSNISFQRAFVPLEDVNHASSPQELLNLVQKGIPQGSNPNQVTQDDIDNMIREVQYHRFPDTSVTVCMVTLLHGFQIVAHHVCNDGTHPTTVEYCQSRALENAKKQIGTHVAFNKMLANPRISQVNQ